jgi:hypothetical protein
MHIKLNDELFLFLVICSSSSAFRYCGGDDAERIDFDVERFDGSCEGTVKINGPIKRNNIVKMSNLLFFFYKEIGVDFIYADLYCLSSNNFY